MTGRRSDENASSDRSYRHDRHIRHRPGHGRVPRWHDGRLWLCDWLTGEVLAFTPDGRRETVARVDWMPFSIDRLADGRLLTTSSDGVVVGPDMAPYGGAGRGARGAGRGWNEIVVDPADRAYVNMPGSMPDEDPLPGVVGAVLPDGSSRVVADDVTAAACVYAWVFNATGGSVLLVAVLHAAENTWMGAPFLMLFDDTSPDFDFFVGVWNAFYVLLAVVVVLLTRGRLGLR